MKNSSSKTVFCSRDRAVMLAAYHFAHLSLVLFFLSIGKKAATSEHICMPWNFLYSEKDSLLICFCKKLISLGVCDFKAARSGNIRRPFMHTEAPQFRSIQTGYELIKNLKWLSAKWVTSLFNSRKKHSQ